MSTTTSSTDGSFVAGHLPTVYSGPFTGSRPLPAIPLVLLRGLFRAGARAFVGYLTVEPELRNEHSLSYLIPVGDLHTAADISIRPGFL